MLDKIYLTIMWARLIILTIVSLAHVLPEIGADAGDMIVVFKKDLLGQPRAAGVGPPTFVQKFVERFGSTGQKRAMAQGESSKTKRHLAARNLSTESIDLVADMLLAPDKEKRTTVDLQVFQIENARMTSIIFDA